MTRVETHRDRGVVVDGVGAHQEAPLDLRRLRFGVATILLGLVTGGGCVVPQQIEQYEPPPDPAHKPIILKVDSVTAPLSTVGLCISPSTINTFLPRISVEDEGHVELTARWFVNYQAGVTESYEYTEQKYLPNDGDYNDIVLSESELGLAGRQPGIYAVEVVVSDGFDALNASPPRRKALPGFNLASYKWVIEYRGGVCNP